MKITVNLGDLMIALVLAIYLGDILHTFDAITELARTQCVKEGRAHDR